MRERLSLAGDVQKSHYREHASNKLDGRILDTNGLAATGGLAAL
jgi:hypothetical protein